MPYCDDGEEIEELEGKVEDGGAHGEAPERRPRAVALDAPDKGSVYGSEHGIQQQRRHRGQRQGQDLRVEPLRLHLSPGITPTTPLGVGGC